MFIAQLVLFESLSPSLQVSPLLQHKYFQRHSERRSGRGAAEPCFGRQGLASGCFAQNLGIRFLPLLTPPVAVPGPSLVRMFSSGNLHPAESVSAL